MGRPGPSSESTPTDAAAARATATDQRPWGLVFVMLTFLLSWVPWLAVLIGTGDARSGPGSVALWVLGGYGPTIAAIVVIAMRDGRYGVRRFLRRLLHWRLGWWYAVLLLPLPIVLVAVVTAVVAGPAAWQLAGPLHWALLPVALVSGVLAGGMEELGWRGELLPQLQVRMSAVGASLIIGLLWSLWHAPLFLLDSTSQSVFSPTWYTLQTVALSVILTWMYNSSRGSVLLVVLFHGALNGWYGLMIEGLAPDALSGFIPPSAMLLTIIAAWLVVRHGPAHLSEHPRQRR